MLTTPFIFQAYIPKTVGGDIQTIMENLTAQSLWVSISKMNSAHKTISKTLSSWLYETLDHSTARKKNNPNNHPQWLPTDTFMYQDQLLLRKYNKLLESKHESKTLGYSRFINCPEWNNYIKNPFVPEARQRYMGHVSPSAESSRGTTTKITSPY
jgi:hypothetical protein